eukprot:5381382-Ditylum_brightwellii.AAC.1
MEVLLPNDIVSSQEQLFLRTRAIFGLVSNICDMIGERRDLAKYLSGYISLHVIRSPWDSHRLLSPPEDALAKYPELSSEPFDLQLLRKEVPFVGKVLRGFHQSFTDD